MQKFSVAGIGILLAILLAVVGFLSSYRPYEYLEKPRRNVLLKNFEFRRHSITSYPYEKLNPETVDVQLHGHMSVPYRTVDTFVPNQRTKTFQWTQTVDGKVEKVADLTQEEAKAQYEKQLNSAPAWKLRMEFNNTYRPETAPDISFEEVKKYCLRFNHDFGTRFNPDDYRSRF